MTTLAKFSLSVTFEMIIEVKEKEEITETKINDFKNAMKEQFEEELKGTPMKVVEVNNVEMKYVEV